MFASCSLFRKKYSEQIVVNSIINLKCTLRVASLYLYNNLEFRDSIPLPIYKNKTTKQNKSTKQKIKTWTNCDWSKIYVHYLIELTHWFVFKRYTALRLQSRSWFHTILGLWFYIKCSSNQFITSTIKFRYIQVY